MRDPAGTSHEASLNSARHGKPVAALTKTIGGDMMPKENGKAELPAQTQEKLAASLEAMIKEAEVNAKRAADAASKLEATESKVASLERDVEVRNTVIGLMRDAVIQPKQAEEYIKKLSGIGSKEAMETVVDFMRKEASQRSAELPFASIGVAPDGSAGVKNASDPGARVDAALDALHNRA